MNDRPELAATAVCVWRIEGIDEISRSFQGITESSIGPENIYLHQTK